jgi:hypothetical protein
LSGASRYSLASHSPSASQNSLFFFHAYQILAAVIMADLEVGDSELNTQNLLRIKADIKELVKEGDAGQKSIDGINTQIKLNGPSVTLEGRLASALQLQRSLCKRANLAVSVIGLSMEDLTEVSRALPCILAIRDLLESIKSFTSDASTNILRRALVVVEDDGFTSCTDVLEDLERTYESISDMHQLRTTTILQATQVAVRELAMTPYNRSIARMSRPGYVSASISEAGSLSVSSQGPYNFQPSVANLPHYNTQDLQDPSQVSDVPTLHRYIDSVLMKVPGKHIIEAVQNLANGSGNGHESLDGSGNGQSDHIVSGLKKEIEDLQTQVRDLKKYIQVKGTHEASVGDKAEVKKEDELLQTEVSPDSNKRPFPAFEDDRLIKRSQS